jgi:hypothetical protein
MVFKKMNAASSRQEDEKEEGHVAVSHTRAL